MTAKTVKQKKLAYSYFRVKQEFETQTFMRPKNEACLDNVTLKSDVGSSEMSQSSESSDAGTVGDAAFVVQHLQILATKNIVLILRQKSRHESCVPCKDLNKLWK